MPRQLPWKTKGAAAAQAPQRPKPPASPALSAGRSPAPGGPSTSTPKPEPTPGPSSKPRRSLGRTPVRSPSTSPPPEPLEEKFMIEGVDNDDKYRMVEDEFLAVAGDFTRHLHTAEYQRLKNLAKSQNADTIQSISRPVTGGMTDLVRRRHAALDTASRQRQGLSKVLGKRAASGNDSTTGDEGDAPRHRPATSLQRLMDSPRKRAAPLALPAAARSGIRGSTNATSSSPSRRVGSGASIKKEPDADSGDDDDHLDGPAPWHPSRELNTKKPLVLHRSTTAERSTGVKAESEPPTDSFSASQDTPNRRGGADDEDDDFFARLRARRAKQKQRRETRFRESSIKASESQATALNEIPFI